MNHRLLVLSLPLFLFAFTANAAQPGDEPGCEHLVQWFNIKTYSVSAGEARKDEMVCPDKGTSEIRLTTSVDVLIVVTRYKRESKARALYDKDGLVEFYSFMKENEVVSEWEGKREGDKFILTGRTGPLSDLPPTQKRLFSRKDFSYTNVEDFPFIAALTKKTLNFSVLNLWNGDLESHVVRPLGNAECPDWVIENAKNNLKTPVCSKVYRKEPAGESELVLSPLGHVISSAGNDNRGPYELTMRDLAELPPMPEIVKEEIEPREKGHWWWPFGKKGDDDKSKEGAGATDAGAEGTPAPQQQ